MLQSRRSAEDVWLQAKRFIRGYYQMKLVLAKILSQYQLVLAEDKLLKMKPRRGFTLAPRGGVRMVMTGKRQKSHY